MNNKQNRSALQNRGRFLPVYLPKMSHFFSAGMRAYELCVSFHALFALRARSLLLVQHPVAFCNAGFRFVVTVFTSASADTWSQSSQHKRLRAEQAWRRCMVLRDTSPTVPLLHDSTSSPMARGRAEGRPVIRTRKYFFAWGRSAGVSARGRCYSKLQYRVCQ
jgi:hypothetical protein